MGHEDFIPPAVRVDILSSSDCGRCFSTTSEAARLVEGRVETHIETAEGCARDNLYRFYYYICSAVDSHFLIAGLILTFAVLLWGFRYIFESRQSQSRVQAM